MTTVSYRNFSGTAAENYQRYFVPAIGTPASAALLEEAGLQPGQAVVDVACGTGVVARLAAERVGPSGSVTGTDLAPDMIEVARSVAAPDGPAIDWRVADAADLPLPDGAADVVLCQMGLMFMEDRAGALSEMRRVLAPGGRIVVSTPGRIQPVFELLEQALIDRISPDLGGFVRVVFSLPDPVVLADLLDEVGFEEVAAREATASLRLPPPADFLWQYVHLTPMGQFVAPAPEEAKAALEQQVVETWAPYVEGDGVPVEQPMVLASGRR